MTVQEAKESIEYLKMQLTEDLEMICFTGDELKALDMSIQALEELEQYRALGTVEELKEARLKQIPKKPIEDDTSYSGYKCPTCNSNVYQLRSHNIMQTPHCIFCGQALKWEEEDD